MVHSLDLVSDFERSEARSYLTNEESMVPMRMNSFTDVDSSINLSSTRGRPVKD